jgi:hypothetical protein
VSKAESPWAKIDRIDRQVTWLIWLAVAFGLLSGALRIIGGIVHEPVSITLDCVTAVNTDEEIVIQCQRIEASR